MNALIDLKIPLESDLMTTVRLLTGGVCSLVGLGLEESEDCKVCVTESLLLLKHGGCRAAQSPSRGRRPAARPSLRWRKRSRWRF